MAELNAGEYYPRMALGGRVPRDNRAFIGGEQRLEILHEELFKIFRVVEPCDAHMDVYSHAIRNVLLLAAMEFEAQCKGVLTANRAINGFSNTNDYVKLRDPLKLEDYELCLPNYPDYSAFRPFVGWETANPTETLWWYDAYNGAKHGRETEFHVATLAAAIAAVAACDIIRCAQWAGSVERSTFGHGRLFNVTWNPPADGTIKQRFPEWGEDEGYKPSNDGVRTEVMYPF